MKMPQPFEKIDPKLTTRGADIRFIQQLLGHEKFDTTAIYTEVSIKQLQEVHARCHPTAKETPAEPASA